MYRSVGASWNGTRQRGLNYILFILCDVIYGQLLVRKKLISIDWELLHYNSFSFGLPAHFKSPICLSNSQENEFSFFPSRVFCYFLKLVTIHWCKLTYSILIWLFNNSKKVVEFSNWYEPWKRYTAFNLT